MKIASWNVNSIKARQEHLLRFLEQSAPDIVFLQELKGEDFPYETLRSAGYHALVKGQKAYNGVAVLSRNPLTLIADTLPGDDDDTQARYLECADAAGTRFINIYLPNGNPVDSEKFPYKLKWMERLLHRLKELRDVRIPFLVGGDFNIIPEALDCHDPKAWEGDALFRPESRSAYRSLLNIGLTEAFRIFHTGGGHYTFWDYQAGAWQRNNGIRIDHFLLSPEMADRAINCTIEKEPRGWDKASDHTPVILEIQGQNIGG